ncbi:MAG: nitrogenase component 1 [Eubacteriales bacterium]
MIRNYLTNITPDSFSGMIFAGEGIKNAVVFLNGPTGCKFYHGAISAYQGIMQAGCDAVSYSELWLFGQSRVPCTYLDKRDYVYGSKEKILDGIDFLKKNYKCELLIVINSPGAALIGDDLSGITEGYDYDFPIITIETSGYSKMIWEGYSDFCLRLIRKFAVDYEAYKNRKSDIKKVNILGLSIFHKYYRGDIAELKNMLALCGIEINCVLCANSTVDEIKNIMDADLNIVLHKDYGLQSAKLLNELYQMPYYSKDGLPIGFSESERFILNICKKIDANPANFIEYAQKARAEAYIHISRLNSLTGLPKGTKFAINATCEECLAYSKFFIKYFGMVAECISVVGDNKSGYQKDEDYIKLKKLLENYKALNAVGKDMLLSKAELVLADGGVIAQMRVRNQSFSGIEIALPSMGYTDVIPKTHIGIKGALMLCEQVINGVLFE